MFTDTLNKVSQGCITHTTLRMIPVIEFTVHCLFQLLDIHFFNDFWYVSVMEKSRKLMSVNFYMQAVSGCQNNFKKRPPSSN